MFPVVYISQKAFFARQLIVFRFLTKEKGKKEKGKKAGQRCVRTQHQQNDPGQWV